GFFFFQAEDGIRDLIVTGVQTCALPISGMHGFTKSLALEVAKKGVTVNTISPGYIGTKMVTAIPKEILDSKILPQIPIGRLGTRSEERRVGKECRARWWPQQ